jgi:hypothetical protein
MGAHGGGVSERSGTLDFGACARAVRLGTRVDPLAEVWESEIIPTDPLAGRSPRTSAEREKNREAKTVGDYAALDDEATGDEIRDAARPRP